MSWARTIPSAQLLLGLVACDRHLGCAPTLTGEHEELEFHDDQVVVGSCGRLRSVAPLAVGTRWCPRIECVENNNGCEVDDDGNKIPPEQVAACFVDTLEGPVTRDGPCLTVEDAGTLVWSFSPTPCDATAMGYAPGVDRLELPVVVRAGLAATLTAINDAWGVANLHPGHTVWPSDARLEANTIAYSLADHPVLFSAVLAQPDGTAVGWNPTDATVDTTVVAGSAGQVVIDEMGVVTATLPAGTRVELTVSWQGTEFPLGTIEGVADDALTEMEIVAGFLPEEGDLDQWSVPIGARAVFHTSDGHVVYGAPVKWEVTAGTLPVWHDPDQRMNPDYVALMDEDGHGCHPPPRTSTPYRATIVGRHGDLEAELELRWMERPDDDSTLGRIIRLFLPPEHSDSELCQGPGFPEDGCGCRAKSPGSAVGLVGLMLVGAFRRRRPPRLSEDRGRRGATPTVRA